jgi:hypothetical protein
LVRLLLALAGEVWRRIDDRPVADRHIQKHNLPIYSTSGSCPAIGLCGRVCSGFANLDHVI